MLTGTASIGPDHPVTELDSRRAAQGDPGELFIVDQLKVGMRHNDSKLVLMSHSKGNGAGIRSRWQTSSPGSPNRTRGTPPTAGLRRHGAGPSCRWR